jgi:hypothetical protein
MLISFLIFLNHKKKYKLENQNNKGQLSPNIYKKNQYFFNEKFNIVSLL